MKHIAFTSEPFPLFPKAERHHGFHSTLQSVRILSRPHDRTQDNRGAFRKAFCANQRPFRAAGDSFEPFTLEEMK